MTKKLDSLSDQELLNKYLAGDENALAIFFIQRKSAVMLPVIYLYWRAFNWVFGDPLLKPEHILHDIVMWYLEKHREDPKRKQKDCDDFAKGTNGFFYKQARNRIIDFLRKRTSDEKKLKQLLEEFAATQYLPFSDSDTIWENRLEAADTCIEELLEKKLYFDYLKEYRIQKGTVRKVIRERYGLTEKELDTVLRSCKRKIERCIRDKFGL